MNHDDAKAVAIPPKGLIRFRGERLDSPARVLDNVLWPVVVRLESERLDL